MNAWLPQQWVNLAGWTILHSLWELAAVAAVLAAALVCLRQSSARWRYGVCCAAMAVGALGPAVTAWVLAPRPLIIQTSASGGHGMDAGIYPVGSHLEKGQFGGWAAPVVWREPGSSSPAATTLTLREFASAHLGCLVWIWITGVGALSLWHLGGCLAIWRLKRRGTMPVDANLGRQFGQLCRSMGIGSRVRLLTSLRVGSPMLVGWIWPVILLPVSIATEMPAKQIEAILVHELAHVARHDYLVNLLQTLIETLLFYHPAIWWISRRIRIEREHCCDDLAVAGCGSKVVYAKALAALEEARSAGPALAMGINGGRPGSMLWRVRRVLGLAPQEDVRSRTWAAVILGVVLAVVIGIGWSGRIARAQEAKKEDVPPAPRAIQIKVVDAASGQPIPNAAVRLRKHRPISDLTDDKGICTFEITPDVYRDLMIEVGMDGYVPRYARWMNDPTGQSIPEKYTVKLEKGTTIGGIVQDEQGKPIAGATVKFSTIWRTPSRSFVDSMNINGVSVTTDEQGRWKLDNAPQDLSDLYIQVEHPDYLGSNNGVAIQLPPADKMHDQTGVVVMKKGIALTGRVTDIEGEPIVGANVSYGFERGSEYPHKRTGPNGQFTFGNAPAGDVLLRVDAPRFAPKFVNVKVAGPEAEVAVKLEPGHVMSARLMDPDGNPIMGATAYPMIWKGHRMLGWASIHSGADGVFTWNAAPEDPVSFDILPPGQGQWMSIRDHTIKPDQDPEVIQFKRALHVSGSVVDEKTGKAIESFTVIPGYPWNADGEPYWLRGEGQQFKAGAFDLTEREPRTRRFFRIEAGGYEPAISRAIDDGAGDVKLEFKLKAGTGVSGSVILADGTPAVGADVVLATASSPVMIDNGRLNPFQVSGPTTKTDRQGKFSLPIETKPFQVVVLHDLGYAQVDKEQLAAGPIKLQPWAKLDGKLMIGSKVGADEQISVWYEQSGWDPAMPRINRSGSGRTDSQGQFHFDRVFAGRVHVGRYISIGHDMWTAASTATVEVKPAESATVQVGGMGRPVVGKVTMPAGANYDLTSAMCTMMTRQPPTKHQMRMPDNWNSLSAQERRKWMEDWRNSQEGKAYMAEMAAINQERRYFNFGLHADGTFRIEDVPAGNYGLSITLSDSGGATPRPGAPGGVQATAHAEFSVAPMPNGRSDELLDIGAVKLEPPHAQ